MGLQLDAHTCCAYAPPLHTAGPFGRAVLFSLLFEKHMEVAPRQDGVHSGCLWVSIPASPFPHQQGGWPCLEARVGLPIF